MAGTSTVPKVGLAQLLRVIRPMAAIVAVAYGTGTPLHAQTPDLQISGKIAFWTNRDGNWEIYTMNADGTGQTRLTHNSVFDGLPDWSPDGTRIAFVSERDGSGESAREIYTMKADGTEQTRLTHVPGRDDYPVWSPDGSRIAFFANRDGNWDIYAMNADGTGETRLTHDPAFDGSPSWSPDGTKIAFYSTRDTPNGDIYAMDVDGTNVIRLTSHEKEDNTPVWSPDGTRILFGSTRDEPQGSLYMMDADGTDVIRLTVATGGDGYGAWSPDGTKIIFFSNNGGIEDIYAINANGTGRIRLTQNAGRNFSGLSSGWAPFRHIGAAGVGSSASRTMTIENRGSGNLSVSNITSSDGQFTISPAEFSVAAGGTQSVMVTFAPTSMGTQYSTITIVSNDPDTPTAKLIVNGKGQEIPPDTSLPPVITLIGDNPLIVECGGAFSDPGATALDDIDGDLSDAIRTSGQVDVHSPGTYTLAYEVSDLAGNASSATRLVHVVDTTPPDIVLELERVRGRGDDDEGDEDGDDEGERGHNRYRVVFSATDLCDARPIVTANIAQPLSESDDIILLYKRDRKKNSIKIQMRHRKIRVTLSGPDRGALQQHWLEALERGGFQVENEQIVKLVDTRRHRGDDRDDDAGQGAVRYIFDREMKLIAAFVPDPLLVARAVDAAGNSSQVVMGLPVQNRGSAKPALAQGISPQGGLLNFPNPFNASTIVAYRVDRAGPVWLALYNIKGQRVRDLVQAFQLPGYYEVEWDGRDDTGQAVSSGVYYYRLVSDGLVLTSRMVLIR